MRYNGSILRYIRSSTVILRRFVGSVFFATAEKMWGRQRTSSSRTLAPPPLPHPPSGQAAGRRSEYVQNAGASPLAPLRNRRNPRAHAPSGPVGPSVLELLASPPHRLAQRRTGGGASVRGLLIRCLARGGDRGWGRGFGRSGALEGSDGRGPAGAGAAGADGRGPAGADEGADEGADGRGPAGSGPRNALRPARGSSSPAEGPGSGPALAKLRAGPARGSSSGRVRRALGGGRSVP